MIDAHPDSIGGEIPTTLTVMVPEQDRERVERGLLSAATVERFGSWVINYENLCEVHNFAAGLLRAVSVLRATGELTLPASDMCELLDGLMYIDGVDYGTAASVLDSRREIEEAQVGVRMADQIKDQLVALAEAEQEADELVH